MVSCSLFLHVRGNLVTKFAQNDIFKCLKSFYSTNCLDAEVILHNSVYNFQFGKE